MKHFRISASFINAFLNGQENGDFENACKRIPMKDNMYFEFGKWFEKYIEQIQETGDLTKPEIPTYPDNTEDVNYDEIEEYVLQSAGNLEEVVAKRFADRLGEGTWQDHISKDIVVKDQDTDELVMFTLHGFTDFLPADRHKIIDLKTTRVGKKEKLENKYEKSIQHGLYCWILGIPDFTYMTYSTWLKTFVEKDYHVDLKEFEETLGLILINFLHILKKKGLENEFESNFTVGVGRLAE